MATKENKKDVKTIDDVRPVLTLRLPQNNSLQIINIRSEDQIDGLKSGLHIRMLDSTGNKIALAFIESFADHALRREKPQNILDIPPLITIKAYNSTLEVRDLKEGDDQNLKQGAYYRWVRPLGSVMVPVLMEPDGNVKILLQPVYRHHIAKFGWEFPMGGLNSGETQLDAAKREFKEETGLAANKISESISGYTDPGTSTANETFYVAQGLRKTSEKSEENEVIGSLSAFSLKECLRMIDKKDIDRLETITGILQIYRLVNEGKLRFEPIMVTIDPTKST